jgi:hypothetical protein
LIAFHNPADTGLDGCRRNQPLAAELLGVQNAYVLTEGPNRFSFHTAKLWSLHQSIKGATESEEDPFRLGDYLLCVRRYLRFKLSFRDLIEIMAERGIDLAHTTIMRWIQRYAPEFEKAVEPLRLPSRQVVAGRRPLLKLTRCAGCGHAELGKSGSPSAGR